LRNRALASIVSTIDVYPLRPSRRKLYICAWIMAEPREKLNV
jgi:hypothetical protein